MFDAGAYVRDLQAAGVKRYVLRLAANCTARRNELPEYAGLGRRPQYGQLVRPLPRQRKGQTIEATEPDFEFSFVVDGRTIRAQSWQNLVLSESKVNSSHPTFSIWVFFDPLYTDPLVLGTDLCLQPLSLFHLYLDRWPVEQVPLVAKQMLGLHRQFVFAPESCQRLPELAMLVGNILSYLARFAASHSHRLLGPPSPKNDRAGSVGSSHVPSFPKLPSQSGPIRKKNSVTAHLPKGIAAHRRQKRSQSEPPIAA